MNSKTSPVIAVNDQRNKGFKIGTVGKVIRNVEVKIAADGEIHQAVIMRINPLGWLTEVQDTVMLLRRGHDANGNIIKLQAPDGTQYGFYHMSAPTTLNISDSVNAGGNVGYVGNTGSNATGYHMHFGTSETGWVGLSMVFANMVNPRDYMSARGVPYPW